MIKAIKAFVDWLDRRFPAKVTVTLEDYGRLAAKVAAASGKVDEFFSCIDYQRGQILKLEESVKALKEAVGKTIAPAAVSAEKRRADFIGSGRITD